MFLAAGQEDGVKEKEGGGSGGVVKTQAGVPFCWLFTCPPPALTTAPHSETKGEG